MPKKLLIINLDNYHYDNLIKKEASQHLSTSEIIVIQKIWHKNYLINKKTIPCYSLIELISPEEIQEDTIWMMNQAKCIKDTINKTYSNDELSYDGNNLLDISNFQLFESLKKEEGFQYLLTINRILEKQIPDKLIIIGTLLTYNIQKIAQQRDIDVEIHTPDFFDKVKKKINSIL